jgi:peptide/nickel transport system ATP-binding protein
VTVDVREGEVLGVVGSTGAGKSTLGMLAVRLLDADGGSVTFDGVDLLSAKGDDLKAMRARLQMLFQDPFEALSPRMTIGQIVREPLDVQGIGDGASRMAVVRTTIADCRLPNDDAFLARHTHELSGGQLQRVALARALVLEPKLVVADEAVSMLDPSEQAKMLQLLKHLQVERGMSMIFISHDLSVVLRVADRVVVLDHGRIVEEGSGGTLLVAPRHPVTRALLAASGRDLLFAENGHAGGDEAIETAGSGVGATPAGPSNGGKP